MKPKHRDHGQSGLGTKIIRWLSPVDEASKARLTEERWKDVNAEFSVHQQAAEFFCLAGLFVGLVPALFFKSFQPWDIGVMFGGMVAAPLLYILTVCSLKGFGTTYPRWSDFSTMKYAVPWRTQFWCVYVLMLVVGAASIAGRFLFPIAA